MSKDTKAHIGPMLGVLRPGEDGHKRITRSEDFTVVGGSEEAHAAARETAIKLDEGLNRKGREVTFREFCDIVREATE